MLKKSIPTFLFLITATPLVFAFAQPIIPSENKVIVGDKAVSIFIDNSFSMNAINKNGTLLDDAKKRAKEKSCL